MKGENENMKVFNTYLLYKVGLIIEFKDGSRDIISMLVSAEDDKSASKCAKEYIERNNNRTIKDIVYYSVVEKTCFIKKEVIK